VRPVAVAAFAVAALAATPADAGPAVGAAGWNPRPVSVRVVPEVGTSSTHFRVTFTARNTALRTRYRNTYYDVEATGPELEGCDSQTAVFRHARRGDRVRVIAPRLRNMADWCPGVYDGTVFLIRENRDADITRDTVVGRFRFEVR
jgi:hypothetical protein